MTWDSNKIVVMVPLKI